MKKFLFLFNILMPVFCFAQTDTLKTDESPFTIVEQMPFFPGGEVEMMKFVKMNVKYPEEEKQANISGTSYVTFVVEKDGSISAVRTIRGVPNGSGCDKEAIRVVSMMPKWNPGKQNGRAVRVQFNLPIKFTLRSKTSGSEADTLYFTNAGTNCSKELSDYFRIIYKQGNEFLVKDYYSKNNQLQMVALCSALNPLMKNGKCTYYSESGKKNFEGNFVNDKRLGNCIIWEKEQKDSLVIEAFEDGTYKNIYVPADRKYNAEYNVYYKQEVMPQFLNGEAEMMKFIQKNVVYPEKEKRDGITGTCYVTFVVEKDGSITDAKILRGVSGGPGCDKEALRVVNSMPNWTPGYQYGRPVRVQFNLPIKFTLRSKR